MTVRMARPHATCLKPSHSCSAWVALNTGPVPRWVVFFGGFWGLVGVVCLAVRLPV